MIRHSRSLLICSMACLLDVSNYGRLLVIMQVLARPSLIYDVVIGIQLEGNLQSRCIAFIIIHTLVGKKTRVEVISCILIWGHINESAEETCLICSVRQNLFSIVFYSEMTAQK